MLQLVPSAFVPEEDEGFFMNIVQAPAGASLEYTTNIAKQARSHPLQRPRRGRGVLRDGLQLQRRRAEQRDDVRAAQGLRPAQGTGAQSCRPSWPLARAVVRHPRRDSRRRSRRRRSRACRRSAASSSRCSTRSGNADINGLAAATFGLMGAGNQSGRVPGALQQLPRGRPAAGGRYRPRQGAHLGLPLREVTDALQVFLGSQYVNDFDFNNRAYRVYAQADQNFRRGAGRPEAALRALGHQPDGAARCGRSACARPRRRR